MSEDMKFAALDRLCRTCLSEKNVTELRSLYENSLEHHLNEITSRKVELNEGLPNCICEDCYFTLNISLNFINQCRRSELQLKNWFSNSQTIIYRSIAILGDSPGEIHLQNFTEISVEDSSNKADVTNISDVIIESEQDRNECPDSSHATFTDLDICIDDKDIQKDKSQADSSELLYMENLRENSIEIHHIDQNEDISDLTSQAVPISLVPNPPKTKSIEFQGPHSCIQCGKKFQSEISLKSHMVKHGEIISCEICGQELSAMQHYKLHMLKNHPDHRPHQCKECGKSFSQQTSLKKHMRTHGGEKKHLCTVCGKRFYEQNHLSIHNRIHTGEKPVNCTLCGKKFASAHGLLVHKKIHTGERNYKCDICDKRFAHSSVLKTHKRTHTGEKPYCCTECDASFRTSSYLRIHLRTHTQEKPYDCEICPKSFVSRCALSAHLITHTGEKKFKCSVCGKTAGRAADLQIHMRSHTGEKPYMCDRCPKRYHTSSNLATHKRTHLGVRDHVCDTCGKAFGDARTLKSHCRTHTGEKPFLCAVCGSRFTQSGQLAVHRKIHQQPGIFDQ
ncbi:unnamed protein product [Phaedon cochleariae]|uniref:C2H2-type domain-containing protein n=1 Tax=Phaedon cochleariae TaxID=80249 RepID=A0A9P0DAT8_PHACE|nr:unnamed protein product [Phaedon cochleariae]